MTRWDAHGPFGDQPGARGTRGRGLAYERRVGAWLAGQATALGWEFHDHHWIIHNDRWLQPDFVLAAPSRGALLIECKLTWVDCTAQLTLYSQALEELGFTPVPLLICRNLTPSSPVFIRELEEASAWNLLRLWI